MTDKTPAQIEADGDETIELEWLGHTVSIPASTDDWDINVTRAFAKGDAIGVLEMLLGRAQFATIEAAHRKAHGGKFRNSDLTPLTERMAEVYGFENMGNSPAS